MIWRPVRRGEVLLKVCTDLVPGQGARVVCWGVGCFTTAALHPWRAATGPWPQKQWRIQIRFSDGFYQKWHAKREVDAFLKERDG